MGYFIENPGMLILATFSLIGLVLLVFGLIRLVGIIKNLMSIGPGMDSPKYIIVSIIMFLIGLLILILISQFGFLFLPAGI